MGNDLDQTSKTVDINICRHYTLVQLIPYMFLMAVLRIYPEYAFCLQMNHPYSATHILSNKFMVSCCRLDLGQVALVDRQASRQLW
jgi:hypothetical protein